MSPNSETQKGRRQCYQLKVLINTFFYQLQDYTVLSGNYKEGSSKPTKHPSKVDINTKLGHFNNIIGDLNKLDEEQTRQDQFERSKEFERDLKTHLLKEMILLNRR